MLFNGPSILIILYVSSVISSFLVKKLSLMIFKWKQH